MADVLALVPARSGSKSIPNKNFKPLADGLSCVDRALLCARQAGVPAYNLYLSTDWEYPEEPPHPEIAFKVMKRPPKLARDDTPMIDVVKHALAQIPGPPEQIILLVQPTQPLREPKHLQTAIALLESHGADSVVSVVEVPRTHNWDAQLYEIDGRLWPIRDPDFDCLPVSRHDEEPNYIRDGTVYAFRRATVATHGNFYGRDVRPLIIPPEETCALDTMNDWHEAERRLREREAAHR